MAKKKVVKKFLSMYQSIFFIRYSNCKYNGTIALSTIKDVKWGADSANFNTILIRAQKNTSIKMDVLLTYFIGNGLVSTVKLMLSI